MMTDQRTAQCIIDMDMVRAAWCTDGPIDESWYVGLTSCLPKSGDLSCACNWRCIVFPGVSSKEGALDFNWYRRFCTKLTGTHLAIIGVLPTGSLPGASACSWGCPAGGCVCSNNRKISPIHQMTCTPLHPKQRRPFRPHVRHLFRLVLTKSRCAQLHT
jgi:hypothetical protein